MGLFWPVFMFTYFVRRFPILFLCCAGGLLLFIAGFHVWYQPTPSAVVAPVSVQQSKGPARGHQHRQPRGQANKVTAGSSAVASDGAR
jgi:uncharacterized iron-regulated membrane protein